METRRTALLVIDIQYQAMSNDIFGVEGIEKIVKNTNSLIKACRQNNIPVIYTRHVYRSSGIDKARYEPSVNGIPQAYREGTREIEIIDEIKPGPDDIVIDKQRWSAFYCTELDIILRSLKVDRLLICGVVTDGCVMTTVYDAYFRDYGIDLVKDACGASNQTVHKAAVLNMANWVYDLRVFDTGQAVNYLNGKDYKAWVSQSPNTMAFTANNLEKLYEEL